MKTISFPNYVLESHFELLKLLYALLHVSKTLKTKSNIMITIQYFKIVQLLFILIASKEKYCLMLLPSLK